MNRTDRIARIAWTTVAVAGAVALATLPMTGEVLHYVSDVPPTRVPVADGVGGMAPLALTGMTAVGVVAALRPHPGTSALGAAGGIATAMTLLVSMINDMRFYGAIEWVEVMPAIYAYLGGVAWITVGPLFIAAVHSVLALRDRRQRRRERRWADAMV